MIFGSHSSPCDPLEFILCLLPGVVLEGRTTNDGGGLDMFLSPDEVLGRILVSFTEIGLN